MLVSPILSSTSVQGWQQIPISENNEALVALSRAAPKRLLVKSMYYEWGISGTLRECYARTGVAERLQQALLLLPNNLSFVIWDTWRPVQVQTTLYSDYRFRLKAITP